MAECIKEAQLERGKPPLAPPSEIAAFSRASITRLQGDENNLIADIDPFEMSTRIEHSAGNTGHSL
jgi:hypothetical protein